MKISTIGPTYPFRGGIAHYNTLLSIELSKKHIVNSISFYKLYPSFLFPGKNQKDPQSTKKIAINAKPLMNPTNPISWFKTVRDIKKERSNAVLLYWWTPFFFLTFGVLTRLLKLFTNTKIIYLCHNVLPHEKTFIDKTLTKFALKKGDFFITHSSEDKKDLLDMFPKAKVSVGVHPTYDIFSTQFHGTRSKKELDLKEKTILFFGFVRPYKGLMYLIKAMPLILKKIDLTLLIVGEFWKDKPDYINLIKKLNLEKNIKIVDQYVPNEEVGKYFSVSDVSVLPYNSATNSGIIQTSFGFNIPVIATAVGGLPEVVTHNKTGLIVPPKDPKAIAEAVIKFYDSNLEEEFKKNIIKEKDRFTWDKIVSIIEDGLK